VVVASLVCGTFTGCDADSFVPPRPEELRVAGGGVPDASGAKAGLNKGLESLASARAVELFLDRRDSDEGEYTIQQARVQAGIDKTKLKINMLELQDFPARQSELVREALRRNPLALILEAADPADRRLAEAVRDARAGGIPVVLLGRPLEGASADSAGSGDGKGASEKAQPQKKSGEAKTDAPVRNEGPLVLVTATPFAPYAKQLVDSAMRNAKNAKLDPRGGAIILINTSSDAFVNDRVTALQQALSAAGLKTIEQVEFAKDLTLGKSILTERLKAQPKITLVLVVDTQAATACREANTDLVETRPFVMAGFASESQISNLTRTGDYAGVADFAPTRVLRKAISTAAAMVQGREVPSRVEIPIVFFDSPPDSGLATSGIEYKRRMQARKPL
jgi:ABC-type sugar transport system substrate-binding protein